MSFDSVMQRCQRPHGVPRGINHSPDLLVAEDQMKEIIEECTK